MSLAKERREAMSKLIEPIVGLFEAVLVVLGEFLFFESMVDKLVFGSAIVMVIVLERLCCCYPDNEKAEEYGNNDKDQV